MKNKTRMEQRTDFHRIQECPDCETYWRETGRHTVGFVEYESGTTCPNCSAS